jgi:uncharacterized protein (TIGR02217 family)
MGLDARHQNDDHLELRRHFPTRRLPIFDGLVVDPADYTVSRPGGIVQFAIAPEADAVITAGFLFDVNVRFENDDALAPVLRAHHVAGFAEMTLLETRVC